MNFQFFTHGIPSLIKWDYSFFGGNAQMFQYLLFLAILYRRRNWRGFLKVAIFEFFEIGVFFFFYLKGKVDKEIA